MIRNKAIATMKAFLGFQMVPVSINLSVTSNPDFKVTILFNAKQLENGTR